MYDFLIDFLMPRIEHVGVWGYWFVFLIAFVESLVFVGILVPGTVIVVFMGFLAGQGYFDIGDIFWFAFFGAIIGDGTSFYLGKRGLKVFGKYQPKVIQERHLVRGEAFFQKHGGKSVFFGRFVGPLRPMVPFIAGTLKMDVKKFIFWNVTSAGAWSGSLVLLGYFFGQTWGLLVARLSRIGILLSAVTLFLLFLYWSRRWILVKGNQFLTAALASFQALRLAAARHPIAAGAILSPFFVLAESILLSRIIMNLDARVEAFLYDARSPLLVQFFLWITMLGKSTIVLGETIGASVLFWIWRKRDYISTLAIAVSGSVFFSFLGKWLIHRSRPTTAVYLETSASFPSGHAALAIALYGSLLYLLAREGRSWTMKVNVFFAATLLITLIGFSRLYLGVHFLSDVIGGYLVGMAWLLLGIIAAEHWRSRKKQKNEG